MVTASQTTVIVVGYFWPDKASAQVFCYDYAKSKLGVGTAQSSTCIVSRAGDLLCLGPEMRMLHDIEQHL